MIKAIAILSLLLLTACNPLKKLLDQQAQINAIADAVSSSRVMVYQPGKDSVVYSPGRIDSTRTVQVDSATNTVTEKVYFTTHDSVKIFYENVRSLADLRASFDRQRGVSDELERSIADKDRQIRILFIVCLAEAVVLGILLFFIFKI